MSYDKAMKHACNVRKHKKQRQMYMGFDTGSGAFKESASIRELTVARMEVNRWFKERHEHTDPTYMRKCIRQSIAHLREIMTGFTGTTCQERRS